LVHVFFTESIDGWRGRNRFPSGKFGRVLQDLTHLANDAGAVYEKASWGEIGCAAYVNLGAAGTRYDPDVCLFKPMPLDQDRIFVAR
jgi:hypothetical protein